MAGTKDILIAIRADNAELKAKLEDSQKAINKMLKKSQKQASSIGSIFAGVSLANLAKSGSMAAVEFGKEMVNLAGDVDSVRSSFNGLTANVKGGGKELLRAVKEASAGTVSELEIMRSSNLALTLMGAETAEKLPEMMKIARAAARSQGVEVQQMYNDIIVASGRQSVQILDNLGISSVVARKYQNEYAASLGKTSEQLNDTEKSAAFFHAVIKAGGDVIKDVGLEALSMGERLQIAEAQMKDFKTSIAEGMTPALEEVTTLLTEAGEEGSSFGDKLGQMLNDLILNFTIVARTIKAVPTVFVQAWQDIKNAVGGQYETVKLRRTMEAYIVKKMYKEGGRATEAYIAANRDMMKALGFTNDMIEYLDGTARALGKGSYEMKVSGYNAVAEARKNKKTPSGGRAGAGASSAGGSGGKPALSDSEFSAYTQGYASEGTESDKAKKTELLAAEQEYRELVNTHALTAEQKVAIDEAYDAKRRDIENKYVEFTQEHAQQIVGALSNTLGMASEVASMASQNKLTALENDYNKQKELIEKSITDEGEKEKALAKLEEKFEKDKKKAQIEAFNTEKKFQIAETLMNIPVMAANAYLSLSKIPFVGPALGAAAAAAATIFGFQKLKLIQESQPPAYETGYIPNDHHLAYVDSREAIINRASTQANIAALEWMNANPGKSFAPSITPNQQPAVVVGGGDMYLDSYYVGKWVYRNTANGTVKIHENGVVSR